MDDKKENPSFELSLARDSKKGLCDAAALPDRLSRYSKAHHRALDMADYIKTSVKNKHYSHLPGKLKDCGSYLVFRDYYTIGEVRLAAMQSCKMHLLCPFCAIRRGAKAMKNYLDRVEVVQAENPKLKAYLVTFTVVNGEDLSERFSHIQKSLQRYHQQRKQGNYGKGPYVEACKALGAVWSYEFKRGKGSGLWHPHVHAVWLCEDEPDQDQISQEWLTITGDSHVVNVTPFYDQDDITSGFLEVFKYAVKFADLPLDQNWQGYETLRGKRLISSFGALRGVTVPEALEDEQLDDLPYIELFYRFIRGAGYSFAGTNTRGGVRPIRTQEGGKSPLEGQDSLARCASPNDARQDENVPLSRPGQEHVKAESPAQKPRGARGESPPT